MTIGIPARVWLRLSAWMLIGLLGWVGYRVWQFYDLVPVPDPILEAALREAIDLPEGPLTHGHLQKITELRVDRPVDLRGLQYCSSLQRLSIGVTSPDFDPRHSAPLIRDLATWQFNQPEAMPPTQSDLTLLTNSKALHRLSLWGYDLHDPSVLTEFPSLQYVSLTAAPLDSFSAFARMPQLRGLYLQSTTIPDMTPLGQCPHLHELAIAGMSPEAVVAGPTRDWLRRMPELERLELVRTGLLELDGVSGLHHLKTLNLQGNDLKLVPPVLDLLTLREINLANNHIEDVRPLDQLVYRNRTVASAMKIDLRGNPLDPSNELLIRNMEYWGAKVLRDESTAIPEESVQLPHWLDSYFPKAGAGLELWE